MALPNPIDYLVIGHVTQDVTPDGLMTGGTVSYSGRTAVALGCRTAVLTSAAADFDFATALPGIDVHNHSAPTTTTFENIYTEQGRVQYLYDRSADMGPSEVPAAWLDARIVHLAPLTNEVDAALIDHFPDSIVGMTPQGWLRRWDDKGRVSPTPWRDAERYLPRATAVILSEEDLPDRATLVHYYQLAPLLVLTQGHDGCTVFIEGQPHHVGVTEMPDVNPTGAGDIFATAFLVQLQRSGDPLAAAAFANQVAAASVTRSTLDEKVAAWRHLAADPVQMPPQAPAHE